MLSWRDYWGVCEQSSLPNACSKLPKKNKKKAVKTNNLLSVILSFYVKLFVEVT